MISQEYGCAIIYADNYDINAVGCSNSSLDCCHFTCNLEYPSNIEENDNSNIEDCNDEKKWNKLDYNYDYLNNRLEYILDNNDLRNRDIYEIPIVFHDVYGYGYLEQFDEFRPGLNDDGEVNRSLCNEITDMATCECLGYKAVQILTEQYSIGNIEFYRACIDNNGNILSRTECNSGQGELIEFQLMEDFISKDENNLPGHPESNGPNPNDGWSNYFDNVINVYITECIQFNWFAENCYFSLNGFANRGSYGTEIHRGLAIRQDVFYTTYSDINEIKNYSTLPHELGHTFNLNHVWNHNNSCGFVDYDPQGEQCLLEGDMICDTETAPCEGFSWQRTASWKNELDQIFCTFMGQSIYPTGINDCGDVSNEDLYSRVYDNINEFHLEQGTWNDVRFINSNISENLSLYINPVTLIDFTNDGIINNYDSTIWNNHISDSHDTLGRTYGTRDINQYWNEECEEWYIDDLWTSIEEETLHTSPVHNFMANKNVSHCRNLGCSNIDSLCTPLEGFTSQQLISARYDIEYYLFGCTNRLADNFNPNSVIDDGSCIYSNLGDINQDNIINITDIILIISIILNQVEPTSYQLWASDFNQDSFANVIDVVAIVDFILNQ